MSKDEEDTGEAIEIGYNPLGDQPFGLEEMMAQSAAALDLAAVFAHDRKDIDSLIRVSEGWTKLAKVITSLEVDDIPKKTKIKFGFGPDVDEEEEEEDGEPTDSTGVSPRYSQNAKLRKRHRRA